MTDSVVDEAQVTWLGYQGNLPSKPSIPDNLGTHTYTQLNLGTLHIHPITLLRVNFFYKQRV